MFKTFFFGKRNLLLENSGYFSKEEITVKALELTEILSFSYTVNHGLNLAMPRHNGARFFNPEPFRPDMVRPFYDEDEQPNVIANHLVASSELFDFIPDAFTFTILRSVPSLYESTFEYFKTSTKAFENAGNIDTFYSKPEEFYSPGSHYNEYTRNHMGKGSNMPRARLFSYQK